jgi:peroxiredoxin (alkyl hydroperoxide reductase subunit C)
MPSEMGDNMKINILKKLQNNKKLILFWYPKILLSFVQLSYTLFKLHCLSLKKEIHIVIGASVIRMKFTLPVEHCKKNNGGEGLLTILADTNRNLSNILGILDIDSTEYSGKLIQL